MQDLVVLVPGITGSALQRPHSKRPAWDLSIAALRSAAQDLQEAVAALALPADLGDAAPPATHSLEPTGIITGWHIWPGFWVGRGYGRMIDRLNRAVTHRDQLVEFAFDWRLSNRVNALRLKACIDAMLPTWRRGEGTSKSKVIYVCHSMGGLLVRYYLEVLGGRETARRVITLGTPYSGSINAIRAILGDPESAPSQLGELLRSVARTFPSVYQLFPTYRCVRGSDAAYLSEVSLPGIDHELLQFGARFRDDMDAAESCNGVRSYDLYAFGGKNQPTLQSLTISGNTVLYSKSPAVHSENPLHGDGTVPSYSAVPASSANTAVGTYFAARHSSLQSRRAIIDLVIDRVMGVDLGEFLVAPEELSLEVPDVVTLGQPIPIAVLAARTDLLLMARVTSASGVVMEQEFVLRPDGLGGYHTALPSPPRAGAWLIEVYTAAVSPQSKVDEIVAVLED